MFIPPPRMKPVSSYSIYMYPGEECLRRTDEAIDVVNFEMKYAKSDETRKALAKVLDCIHVIKESAVSTRDGKHVILEKSFTHSKK